ncbi:MAG: tetratricopeptide repeat protein [Sphingobacteriales bacterium]|nr:tetratricopeptide repeat protein [Sphingobacteriales bacterium]
MKLKLYTVLFSGLVLLMTSCKSAGKLYEKGRYDEAVELAAKKLQKDPSDPKLLGTLRNAYTYARNDHESRIRSFSESNNELKWEWIYYEYISLQKMYEAIHRSPDVFSIVRPEDYSSSLVTYREKAGDTRYERGLAFMQHSTKQSYRDAYREFQAALNFRPGDRDALLKMNEVFEYAVTNVVIAPMQREGGFVYSAYRVGNNNLDDELISGLQQNSGNEFVRFYSAWDARSRRVRVDNEISLRFVNVDLGRVFEDRSTRKVNKEVVVKETVYRPDSVVREYAKVHASIVTTQRTLRSTATLQVTVRDENGRRIWSDTFGSSYNWSTGFSHFTGDERALSQDDKNRINRRMEFPPSENDMMKCMVDEISNNAIYSIRSYFNRNK